MIQLGGKTIIKRYLASQVPAIAQTVAFGVGDKAESNVDTHMHFEVERADITLVSYDFTNNKLIFKAELPNGFAGTIYEVGLYSLQTNPASGNYGSKLLVSFDSDSEDWQTGGTSSTFSTTYARIGIDSLRHATAASNTTSSTLSSIALDLSGNSGADQFLIAFNNLNSNTANVTVRLKTDSSNYYSISVNNPATGYVIYQVDKATATATGSPDWSNITSLEVLSTAKTSGTSTVDFEGIRIEDTDTINPDYAMVSRELLGSPFTVTAGMVQEVEFSLDVNV